MELRSNIWWHCVLKGFGWEVAGVGGLLAVSIVLSMYEWTLISQGGNFGDIVRAHMLAGWFYILGLVGLAASAGRAYVRARMRCR